MADEGSDTKTLSFLTAVVEKIFDKALRKSNRDATAKVAGGANISAAVAADGTKPERQI